MWTLGSSRRPAPPKFPPHLVLIPALHHHPVVKPTVMKRKQRVVETEHPDSARGLKVMGGMVNRMMRGHTRTGGSMAGMVGLQSATIKPTPAPPRHPLPMGYCTPSRGDPRQRVTIYPVEAMGFHSQPCVIVHIP